MHKTVVNVENHFSDTLNIFIEVGLQVALLFRFQNLGLKEMPTKRFMITSSEAVLMYVIT